LSGTNESIKFNMVQLIGLMSSTDWYHWDNHGILMKRIF